ILAEKKARAKGVQKENEALAGSGGKTMVKLRLAEALAGKQILFLPSSKGGGLQTLNMNQLLSTFAASQALEAPSASKGAAAHPEVSKYLVAGARRSTPTRAARRSVRVVLAEVGHLLLAQLVVLLGITWVGHR